MTLWRVNGLTSGQFDTFTKAPSKHKPTNIKCITTITRLMDVSDALTQLDTCVKRQPISQQ